MAQRAGLGDVYALRISPVRGRNRGRNPVARKFLSSNWGGSTRVGEQLRLTYM